MAVSISSRRTAASSEEERSARMARRRMEGELYMLQADRSRFLRQGEEIDAQIRMIDKAIEERELEREGKQAEKLRLAQKVQELDIEILRIKRQSYKKPS